ncbi:hypothetical protein N9L76_05700 [bacterium]|nr:hypothetical protein [bacterium]
MARVTTEPREIASARVGCATDTPGTSAREARTNVACMLVPSRGATRNDVLFFSSRGFGKILISDFRISPAGLTTRDAVGDDVRAAAGFSGGVLSGAP